MTNNNKLTDLKEIMNQITKNEEKKYFNLINQLSNNAINDINLMKMKIKNQSFKDKRKVGKDLLRNVNSKKEIEFDFSAEGRKIQENIQISPYKKQKLAPSSLNKLKSPLMNWEFSSTSFEFLGKSKETVNQFKLRKEEYTYIKDQSRVLTEKIGETTTLLMEKENEYSLLLQKYNEKCSELYNIECSFETLSDRFFQIMEQIKSQQQQINQNNIVLKDLLIYILSSFHNRNFSEIKHLIDFILLNDTFIDKSIFGQNCQVQEKEDSISLNRNNTDFKISEEKTDSIFFEQQSKNLKERCFSVREILGKNENEFNGAISNGSNYSKQRNQNSLKSKNLKTYTTIMMNKVEMVKSYKEFVNGSIKFQESPISSNQHNCNLLITTPQYKNIYAERKSILH